MSDKELTPDMQQLRARAQKPATSVDKRNIIEMSVNDIAQLLHELDTYQIELEMQNEDLRTAQVELMEARDRYAELYDFAPVGYITLSKKGLILQTNLAFSEMLGVPRSELVNRPLSAFIVKEDNDHYYISLNRVIDASGKHSCELRLHTQTNSSLWVRLDCVCINTPDNTCDSIRLTVSDISQHKQAEEKLHLAASVFSHAREGITITNTDGKIIEVNEAFTRITGYSRDEVLGQNPRMLKSGLQDQEFYAAMWRGLTEKGHWYGEIWNCHKNGKVYPEMLTISTVHDAQGKAQHYVALFSDITTQKQHQKQLEFIAHYDALTGLPNRVLLADRLHQSMANANRSEQPLAVAFLDLDGFKDINDTYGHEIGDQLLIIVAARMKESLRTVDTIARLGGDEFVVVLNALTDTKTSAPMLDRLLAAAAQPVHIEGLVLHVTASIGVTFYPQAERVDADQLVRQADQAMYQAKLAGKNRYHLFDAEQDRGVRGYHESLDNIRRAMSEHEFALYYQPKVNMRTGELVGSEAVIRWRHPQQGLLLPNVFLPVIEDHPLAIELGEWVINTALAQLETWHAAGLKLSVSVNVGALQIQQDNFTQRLCELMAAHPDVKPGFLELEVLETSALDDMERMSAVMHRCSDLGVGFALDDFGTGYSSLTYLKRLPAAQLKIDQSFVRDMLEDTDDLAIVEGVLGLAKAFRRQPIAEGVESVEHGVMLLQLGCELAQGYCIARPMPAEELQSWTTTWQPDPSWKNQNQVSSEDLPLLFASVEHRAWIKAVGEHLKGERAAPPPLDYHQCRFGQWLDGDGRTRHGARSAFKAIKPLHRQVHTLALELLEHPPQAWSQVQAGLDELYGLRNELLGHLKSLL